MDIRVKEPTLIGVISDTHNLLRANVEKLLKDCDIIVHAGDIGDIEILNKLKNIAPIIAVRGNTDIDPCFNVLSKTKIININKLSFYIIHDLEKIDLDPHRAKIKVVISGHTHQPKIFKRQDVIYINPGSSGYYRKGCPISLAFISIKNKAIKFNIARLDS